MIEIEDNYTVSDRIVLGTTNINISPLGLGTWQWGDKLVWSYGSGEFNDADLQAGFQRTLAAGINFFDTAESYGSGRSETLLGQYLKRAIQEGKTPQDGVVIATKFMPYPWRMSRNELLLALKQSLIRLGLDHVDLFQVHHPAPPRSPETWAASLADAVEAGLAKAVGVSNYSEDWMRRAHAVLARRGIPLASNQVEYSLIVRDPEWNGVLKACNELGITLIAYSPLAKGLLTGKYSRQNPPRGVRRFMARRYLNKIDPLILSLQKIGEAHGGKTPGQVSLNWLMGKGAVPIPGIKNFRHAEENSGAVGWHLTKDEMEELDQLKLD